MSVTVPIFNSLKSTALDVISVSDPSGLVDVQLSNVGSRRVSAVSQTIAEQFNQQRSRYPPALRVVDLEQYIADVVIETTVQGAAFLEVHLIDPLWLLLRRDRGGAAFIDVDEEGFLWPPIEIQFPPHQSEQVWTLCSLKPSTDLSGPNMVLTFEDKIVTECRNHDNTSDPSIAASRVNETRAEFIERCVKTAVPGVRFQTLFDLSQGSPDQFVFSAQDLTQDESTPLSQVFPNQRPGKNGGVGAKDRLTAGQRAAERELTQPTDISLTNSTFGGAQVLAPDNPILTGVPTGILNPFSPTL